MAALIVPVEQYWGWGRAQAATCTNDTNWAAGARGEAKRCINGHLYTTRRQLAVLPGCLGPTRPGFVYDRNTCGKGVEAIGQARGVKYLSDRVETPSQGLISPDVQWEMYQPGNKRPDIVVYDRNNAAAGVDVIEAKVKGENADYPQWGTQVDGYIAHFRSQGMVNVRRGDTLNKWGVYRDEFQVWDAEKTCKTAAGDAGYVRRTYLGTAPQAGLLSIEEDRGKRVCDKDKVQPPSPPIILPTAQPTSQPTSQPSATPTSTPTAEPTMVPIPPITPIPVPAELVSRFEELAHDGGVPGDLLAAGALTVLASALLTEIEAALGTSLGAALLAELALTAPAALALGAIAVAVLITWFLIDHYGAHANGDPHFATVDGLNYDLQSAGEFTLAQSERHHVTIQGRMAPLWASSNVSTLTRVAMEVNEHRVELDNDGLYVDGLARPLETGTMLSLGEGAFVTRDTSGRYLVMWQGVRGPVFAWSHGNGHLYVPPATDSDLVGLFGDADGDPSNDLKLADGTRLPADTPPAVLHADYADSWRITDDESLFTYAPGQNTATFTDLTYPRNIVTWHDLAPDQIALATTKCEAAGVPAGPAFNGCVLDVALTADTAFATGAAQRRTAGLDPLARGVDAAGDLSTDFESPSLPTNLSPARLSGDPGTTSFAGPFTSTESYRFYVQALPSHLGGTLSFDLLTLGDWTTGTEARTVTVQTDRANPYTVTPSTLTPVASGTLAGGVPYKRYRVTVPFTHSDAQAEFKVSATGISGIANQAFGVDDLALHVQVVPPQSFTGSLPLSVSDGVPGPGAGNLENTAAEDDYRFDVPAGGAVYIDPTACPGGSANLRWTLETAAGAAAGSGYGCQGAELRNLAPGPYRLAVKAQNGSAGSYALRVTAVPADVTATAAVDGAPATLTTTAPGQNGGWTFTGTTGQNVYLDLSAGTVNLLDAEVSVIKPDGTTLRTGQYCGTSCGFDTFALPADGTYTVRYDPRAAVVGSLTATIRAVPTDTTAALAADGTASRLTTTVPGQNGVWTFTGTTGQRVHVDLSAGTLHLLHASASLVRPDGTVLSHTYCGTSCGFDTTTLPANGTYKVVFDPQGNATGSLTARLWSVPSDPATTIATDGTASRQSTTVPGQNAVWTFTGTAGQRVGFGFTDGTLDVLKAQVSVLKPDGTALRNWQYCGTSCTFDTTTLPADGTYRVVFDPQGTATGSLTVAVSADVARPVTTDGTASVLTTGAAGQNGAWTFTGTAGQRVYFDFSAGTFGAFHAEVSVLKPDGTTLLGSQYCGTSCGLDTTVLPVDGTYSVLLRSTGPTGGSLTARLYTVPADLTGPIATDGTPAKLTTTTPGQNGGWTFTGTAGQRVLVDLSGGTLGIFSAYTSILKPDGTALRDNQYCGDRCVFDTTTLPVDGTYTVRFDPQGNATGSLTARLWSVPADPTTTIATDGTPATVTTTVPGQNGGWTFAGTAGQKVGLGFTGGTLDVLKAQVSVLRPDGTTLLASQYCGATCTFATTALPVDGVYKVVFDPQGTATGALTLSVSADVVRTVTTDGTASTLTTTAAGQNGSWTFAGTAGQRVYFDLSAGTFGTLNAEVSVLRPDGTTLVNPQYCGAGCGLDTTTLPVDGTYTVALRTTGTTGGSLTAKLYTVPADATATIATDGTPSKLTTTVPGQNGVWTFTGTAGQKVGFGFSGGTLDVLKAGVSVLKPDGTALRTWQYCGPSCTFDTTTLPVDGTYKVVFDPQGTATGSLTLSASGDVLRAVATDGTPSVLTTTAAGQNGSWTFTGTAGQRVYFDFSAGTFSSFKAEVFVLRPDGTTLLNWQYCGTSCGFDTTTLPVDGTYTVGLRTTGTTGGSLTAKLYTVPADATTAIATDGTPSKLTTTVPGQNGVWTFAATAGQRVYLDFSGGTISTFNAQASVLKPDGTVLLAWQYCGDKCVFDTTALPVDGTYTVRYDPQGNATGSLTAKLWIAPNLPATPVTTDGTAAKVTTTVPGQNGSWTFTGTAGQRVYLDFSGGAMDILKAQVALLKPDGTTLRSSQYCGDKCAFDTTTLPADGTYTVLYDPQGSTTGSLTAKVWAVPANPVTPVTTDGTAAKVTTTVPGQNGSWTFTGTAGQRVYLDFSGGAMDILKAQVALLKPDGTTLRSSQYCGDKCAFDTTTLPADGTYTVLYDPQGSTTGSLTIKVWSVPAEPTTPVAVDGTPVTLATTTPGQNGSWTFTGTAGQKVAFAFSGGSTGGSLNAMVSVLKPDGTTLRGSQYCGVSCTFDATTLPAAGQYKVLFDPQGSAVGALTAKLTPTP
ncbi:VWD domain-containing protein [Kitasatospora sp. NPDC004240]